MFKKLFRRKKKYIVEVIFNYPVKYEIFNIICSLKTYLLKNQMCNGLLDKNQKVMLPSDIKFFNSKYEAELEIESILANVLKHEEEINKLSKDKNIKETTEIINNYLKDLLASATILGYDENIKPICYFVLKSKYIPGLNYEFKIKRVYRK